MSLSYFTVGVEGHGPLVEILDVHVRALGYSFLPISPLPPAAGRADARNNSRPDDDQVETWKMWNGFLRLTQWSNFYVNLCGTYSSREFAMRVYRDESR